MKSFILASIILLAAACQPADDTGTSGPDQQNETPIVSDETTGASAGAAETPSAGIRPPQDVLRGWADALEGRDWERARVVWGEGGEASGLTPSQFASAFEKYATIDIEIGDAETEGAAGSLYYQPTVVMSGDLQNGEAYRMEGPVRLRRANDVPGATPEQLRWHIEDSGLRPRPVEE